MTKAKEQLRTLLTVLAFVFVAGVFYTVEDCVDNECYLVE